MDKPGVIVLGGHVQALGIIRAYGRMGLNTIIVDKTARNISRHSIYCNKSFVVDDNELLNFLLTAGRANKYRKWLIFPTNDFHVKLISQNKSELEEYFIVTTDDWESVKVFYNKKETYNLAKKLEIPIACTFFPANEDELHQINPAYPCIIKPAVMHDFYSKVKKKVFVCHDKDELINNYRRACSLIPSDEIIVQDIIKGPSSSQYSACYLFLDGKPYVSLTATRMRQHPIDFGNATTYAETIDLPILKVYAEKILGAANYNGLCEVEFKKDDTDGQYKFLEVNTRTWKWHAIAEKAGTPFLENYYKYLNGAALKPMSSQNRASFRHALTDFPIQIKLFLLGHKYAFRRVRPLVKAVWARDDFNPWFFEKFYLINLIKDR